MFFKTQTKGIASGIALILISNFLMPLPGYSARPLETAHVDEMAGQLQQEILSRSEMRPADAEQRVSNAIQEIKTWKHTNQPLFFERRPDNPFRTYLLMAAKDVFDKYKLYELKPLERLQYVDVAFDGEAFPKLHATLHSILKRIEFNREALVGALDAEQYYKLGQVLSDIEDDLSFRENRLLRAAINRIFDFWDREKRVLELGHVVNQIDLELAHPGQGKLPLVAATQDLHGGSQRAASLIGYVLGLNADVYKDLSSYNEVEVVKRLELLLRREGIDIDKAPVRVIGLNDKYDRGDDPIGVYELVKWLKDHRKAKPFMGNHDIWRTIAVLGIHHYFAQKEQLNFEDEKIKGDHLAHWAKEAFEHAGWGDIELDQINQRRFNKALGVINEILQANGEEAFKPIDLMALREQFSAELGVAKKHNAKVRTSLQRGETTYTTADYRELPDIFEQTLAALRRQKETYNLRIQDINGEMKLDIPKIEFAEVNLENFYTDSEIIDRALWELRNARLFHIDILGNLHNHNILPVNYEQGGFDVTYQGVKGIPALELMEEDLITFGEERSSLASGSQAFREQVWKRLGEALKVTNSWYSDLNPVAKAPAVRKFIDQGGLATLSEGILGQTMKIYTDREANLLVFWGHNEFKKLQDSKVNLPYIYLYPDQGTGIVNLDYEMSKGYSDQGAVVTFFKRDAEGKMTGMRRWGYRKGSEVVEDLTFVDVEGLNSQQREFLETLADGPKFLKWYRERALNQILQDATRLKEEAVQKNRPEKADYFQSIIERVQEELRLQPSEANTLPVSEKISADKAAVEKIPTAQRSELRGKIQLPNLTRIATNQLANLQFPRVASEKAETARSKYSSRPSEALIVDSDFAFNQGGLALVPTLSGNKPAVVVVKNDQEAAFVEAFNQKLPAASQIAIARDADEAVKLLRRKIGEFAAQVGGVQADAIKEQALVGPFSVVADALKKQLGDKWVKTVDPSMFQQLVIETGLGEFVAQFQKVFSAFSQSA